MAIYIVDGNPGSGKTYFVINHLIKKYFVFDDVLKEFFPKGAVAIITNVEELRLDHYNLDEMVKKAGGAKVFWTVDYQKELLKRWVRIVYIVDEAGAPDKFHRSLRDENILFLFQYHRHLGLDFYLIAPSVDNITFQISKLAEYTVRAYRRGKTIGNRFRYDRLMEGDRVGIFWLKKDTNIFRLYKSMRMVEGETIKSAFKPLLIGALVLLVLMCFGIYRLFSHFFGGERSFIATAKPAVASAEKTSPGAERFEKAPPLKVESRDGVTSKVASGGSLSGAGVKGGTVQGSDKLPVGQGGSYGRSLVRVRVFDRGGGDLVVWTDDGYFLDTAQRFALLNGGGVRIGNEMYIERREGLESNRGEEKRAGERVRESGRIPAPKSGAVLGESSSGVGSVVKMKVGKGERKKP